MFYSLKEIIIALLFSAPVLLVWLTGIVLSIINRRKYPNVAFLTLIATTLLFLLALIEPFVYPIVSYLLSSAHWSSQSHWYLFRLVGFIFSLLAAVGFGLLLTAVFRWRSVENRNY